LIRDLLPLIAALLLAATVYAIREIRRRRFRVNPPEPDIAVAEVWELWLRDHREPLTGAVKSRVQEILAAAETACSGADHPRAALRQAILGNAVIALHLDAVSEFGEQERAILLRGYEPGMDALLQDARTAATIAWRVLRRYGRLKYDDAVPEDWFDNFMWVAAPYIREKTRLAREFVVRMDEGSGRIVEIYDQLLQELRTGMMKARPKKRFVPPDIQ